MTAYYNENDPKAAAWLRELIKQGHIAPGVVDERSIEDIKPDEIIQYTQCHFFAGIGVWSYALRQAGWPDDKLVWTGSCPCQPFSTAGKGKGLVDERHLWPAWHHLISQRKPGIVFGEQVASKDGLGWLDIVQTDMEAEGYAFGAVDTCAAGFGAPHIRQRLYFTGQGLDHTTSPRHSRTASEPEEIARDETWLLMSGSGCTTGGLADPAGYGRTKGSCFPKGGRQRNTPEGGQPAGSNVRGIFGGLDNPLHGRHLTTNQKVRARGFSAKLPIGAGRLADGTSERRQRGRAGETFLKSKEVERLERLCNAHQDRRPSPTNGYWAGADWLLCRDGKFRAVRPGSFPLANGAAQRVGRLRGYGNAIVAPQAQAFIETVMETL